MPIASGSAFVIRCQYESQGFQVIDDQYFFSDFFFAVDFVLHLVVVFFFLSGGRKIQVVDFSR